MISWKRALQDGSVSGGVASLVSTLMLTARGIQEKGQPFAPTNATSQWIWGERAIHENAPSVRHTVAGYLIHHLTSVFWAAIYEKWVQRDAPSGAPVAIAKSAAIAALAYVVDYHFTPRRLRPGFERRLSKPSLLAVYAIFGAGLAAVSLWSEAKK